MKTDELLTRAAAACKVGDFKVAKPLLTEIISRGNAPASSFQRLAIIHRKVGDVAQAESVIAEGLREHPQNMYLLIEQAHNAAAAKDWTRFFSLCDALYRIYDADVPVAFYDTCLEYAAAGQRGAEGVRLASRLNSLTPDDWQQALHIGSCSLTGLVDAEEHAVAKRKLYVRTLRALDIDAEASAAERAAAFDLMLESAYSASLKVRGSKTLVVMLSAAAAFSLKKFEFGTDVLYLTDNSRTYFCVPLARIVRMVAGLIAERGYQNVSLVGCSKAAAGALMIGSVLSEENPGVAVNALAFSPQTQIYPHAAVNDYLPSYQQMHKAIGESATLQPYFARHGDLQNFDYSRLNRCRVYYGAWNPADSSEAIRLEGRKGVDLVEIPSAQHYTLGFFTCPKDMDLESAKARFAAVNDPDVVATRTDDAVEEYAQLSSAHGYSLLAELGLVA